MPLVVEVAVLLSWLRTSSKLLATLSRARQARRMIMAVKLCLAILASASQVLLPRALLTSLPLHASTPAVFTINSPFMHFEDNGWVFCFYPPSEAS